MKNFTQEFQYDDQVIEVTFEHFSYVRADLINRALQKRNNIFRNGLPVSVKVFKSYLELVYPDKLFYYSVSEKRFLDIPPQTDENPVIKIPMFKRLMKYTGLL